MKLNEIYPSKKLDREQEREKEEGRKRDRRRGGRVGTVFLFI